MPLYAICPFFKYERPKTICCEFKNVSFPTTEDKRLWMLNHCCSWDYECCSAAAKLMKKYEEMYKMGGKKQESK